MSQEPKSKDSNNKAESTASASANAAPHAPFNPFSATAWDPLAAFSASQQNWHKVVNESLARAQSWADEYAAIEQHVYARALQAVDTWAQLARDTIQYGQQLSGQARKLGLETIRKAGVAGA